MPQFVCGEGEGKKVVPKKFLSLILFTLDGYTVLIWTSTMEKLMMALQHQVQELFHHQLPHLVYSYYQQLGEIRRLETLGQIHKEFKGSGNGLHPMVMLVCVCKAN